MEEQDVYSQLYHQLSPFQRRCRYNLYNMRQADERTTGIDKKLMEIDQNDRDPINSTIKLSKATIEVVHTSKSDPDRPFPAHRTYSVHTKQQTVDERTTRIDKKLMEIDKINKIHPTALFK